MRKIWLNLLLIAGVAVQAEEPGYYEVHPSTPPSAREDVRAGEEKKPTARRPVAMLAQVFEQARGLTRYELQTLYLNRISCGRRMFSPSGQSVEGDGDLKVTRYGDMFVELEFVSHFNFVNFNATNPYGNNIAEISTLTGRQLLRADQWHDGKTLRLYKTVALSFVAEGLQSRTSRAVVDVRVVDGLYPMTYLVRETVLTEPRFRVYYFCE